MNVNWYPGHMAKARRALKDKLKLIDLVVEVLDARAPRSTKNPDFDQLFSGKERMYVLNKEDLADPAVTKRWLSHFRGQGAYAVSYSAASGDKRKLLREIESAGNEIFERYRKKGVNKTVRALVCGIPNVGKSAILNRLAGEKKLKEGNTPGLTRGLSWVKLTPYLELLDSPGLLWPKIKDEQTGVKIALLGSVRQEILDEEAFALYLAGLLIEKAPELLKARYKAEELPETGTGLIELICKNRGFLLKGGAADYERGCLTLLDEFKNGKIGRFSMESPEEYQHA